MNKDILENLLLRTENEGNTVKKVMEILGDKFMEMFAEKTK